MGCCSSCLEAISSSGQKHARQLETEMRSTGSRAASDEKSFAVSRSMSSPSIDLDAHDTSKVSGIGLAVVGVSVEQDSAYWEVHIDLVSDEAEAIELLAGVTERRDRAFFKSLEEIPPAEQAPKVDALMRKIKVKHNDTVGVAVQQDDLPMIQFLLNGEPLHSLSISKFRGSVFPSVFLPESERLKVTFVFEESSFKEMPPTVRFGPLIIARGII